MTRALLAALVLAGCTDAPDATVLAAASTVDVVEPVASELSADVRVSGAASSVLARQIAAGAPADVFVSADPEWVDWLAGRGVGVLRQSVVATGALVVVGAGEASDDAGAALAGRVAIADPSHVPAGRYARKALERQGLWRRVRPRAVFTADVRAALVAVQTGAADRAVVYASDLSRQSRARVLYRFDPMPEIQVVVAQLTPAGGPVYDALVAPEPWRAAGFGPAP